MTSSGCVEEIVVKNCLTPAVIIQQFVFNCRALQEKSSPAAGSLTVSELNNAVMYWVSVCQTDHFLSEIESLNLILLLLLHAQPTIAVAQVDLWESLDRLFHILTDHKPLTYALNTRYD